MADATLTDTPLHESIAAVEDGSTVTDEAALAELVKSVGSAVKSVLSATRGLTTQRKKLAEARVRARALIRTPNGHPDWAASTETYRVTVGAAEASVWESATTEEKRSNDAAIRQLVSRIFLEPILTDYCLSSVNLSDEQRKSLKWQEVGPGLAILVGDIPKPLKDAIKAEYKAADLTVPEKFGGPAKGSQAGPGKDKNAESPEAAMGNVAERVQNAGQQGGPSFASVLLGILRVQSAAAVSMAAASEVQDREKVQDYADRSFEVARIMGLIAHGKHTPKDLETLAEVGFSAENDK